MALTKILKFICFILFLNLVSTKVPDIKLCEKLFQEKNYEKSFECFNSKSDNPLSLHYIGILHSQGLGCSKDIKKSFEHFEQAHSSGLLRSTNLLGSIYYKGGLGTKKNLKKAIEYFEHGETKKDSNSIHNLGLIYFNGDKDEFNMEIKVDKAKAIKYFKAAADLNNKHSSFQLGLLYIHGKEKEIIKEDFKLGFEYLKQSAKLGFGNAYRTIGYLYYDGKGVLQNYTMAYEHFKESLKLKVYESHYDIATCHYLGLGTRKDLLESLIHLTLGCENGFPNICLHLSVMYQHGIGTEKFEDRTKKYYDLSKNKGNPQRLYEIGTQWYYHKDYTLASLKGHIGAMLNLAKMYKHGLGVRSDLNVSKKWLLKAKKLGYKKVDKELKLINDLIKFQSN